MAPDKQEEELLRSTALQNANSILLARQKIEEELVRARDAFALKNSELARSLAMLRATLESTTDAIIAVDEHGEISSWNEKFAHMWNIPRETFAVRQQLSALIAAQVKNPEAFLARAREINATSPAESTDVLELIDGRLLERHSRIQTIEGKYAGRVWSFRDISHSRRREEQLRESEQQLRATFSQAAVGMATARLDGYFEQVNERFSEILGYTTEELTRLSVRDLTYPEDRPSTATLMRRLLEGEIPDYSVEKRYVRKDGSLVWILTTVTMLRDDNGRPQRFIGVIEDISRRREAEDALREEYIVTDHLNRVAKALATELDLDKIVQLITDVGTRVIRAQFGAFFYNVLDEKGASYMLYTLSGVPRSAFEKFPMPRATGLFGPTFRGEGVIRLSDVRQDPRFGKNPPHHGMPTGHLPVVSYLAVPVFSRAGEVMGGLFFGHSEPGVFTERDEKIIVGVAAQAAAAMDTARLYQAEQQARAVAEQANQAKDHFIAMLSHELRTPLTPVLAILSSLSEETNLPGPLARDLETMRRNVELEARLIDDLLDLTRITRGKMELQLERIAIDRLIENAINTCLPELKAKRLTLVREKESTPEEILADGARITQILWNLLKNSIKFTPEDGSITIRTRVADQPPRVIVEVTDTGIGIEPDQIGHVFEAFEQGSRKITQQFGGLGLGLAISKAIAEAHQGEISAESAGAGCGSTFRLTLPLAPVPANVAAVTPSTAAAPPPAVSGKMDPVHRPLRILLVEDHVDTANVLVRMLRRTGYDVVHAPSIKTAREIAEKEISSLGLDLVISDLSLPDGSGLELMRELSTKHHLRGIALSGFGMDSDRAQTSAAGFARHLTKPVNVALVRSTILEVMPSVKHRNE